MSIDLKQLKKNIKSKGVSKMANKVERTEEEKKEFLANNYRINFWMDKEVVKEFDAIAKEKGVTRSEALTKLIEKFVAKNKSK